MAVGTFAPHSGTLRRVAYLTAHDGHDEGEKDDWRASHSAREYISNSIIILVGTRATIARASPWSQVGTLILGRGREWKLEIYSKRYKLAVAV